jgi:hypothetical protein
MMNLAQLRASLEQSFSPWRASVQWMGIIR